MKGRRVRLTDAGVGRLKPHTTEYAVWDSEVPVILPHRIGPPLGYGKRRADDGKEALQA